MTDTTNPQADELLRRAESYLSALHGSVARHDNLAANLACAGCELRDQIRAALRAAVPVPASAPTDRAVRVERYGQVLRRWGLLDEVNNPKDAEDFAVVDLLAIADTEQAVLRTRIAELESSCRDVDRLRRDWVEMRDRAEALDARVQALAAAVLPAPADRATILREAADWFDRYDVDSARELRRLADAAEPVPPVEHCIHDRTVHRTHHTAPVTGCPWCAAAASTEA